MNRSDRIRFALTVLVSALFLYVFVRGVHWRELGIALRGVRIDWLGIAVLFALGDYLVRALRWTVLFRHVDPGVSIRLLWRATALGAALNTVLPLRGGDLVRPAFVARRRGVPFAIALSSTVVERLFDLIGGVIAIGLLAAFLPADLPAGPATLERLQRWGGGAVVVASSGLALVGFLATRRAREAAMVLTRPLPTLLRMRIMRIFLLLARGLEPGGHPLRFVASLALTVALWGCTAGMGWAVFQSLGLDAHPILGLFVAVALTGSIALPQAPGFLGVFQVVTEQAARMWGVTDGIAEASAVVLWLVYIVPISVVGLVYGLIEGGGLQTLWGDEAPATDASSA